MKNTELKEIKRKVQEISEFVKDVLDTRIKDDSRFIELPDNANKKAEQAFGHPIKSHRIKADEIRHINNEHGERGKKNTINSISLRKEDIALLPYIMGAPDNVEQGSINNGKKSVRYYKYLSNGYVVVVEREASPKSNSVENITMWAEKNHSTNVGSANLKGTSVRTSVTHISQNDTTKVMQDFEKAIEK
ncbi:hypothetical protein FACS1894195_5770 [Bacteroidia bacterium]|nr:hypothetical protein FACS1894195_5770 [Bacteroidia bacterium]